ncbi:curli assembly protein CsgC [Enterobacteriaceae bacterium H11S18]|uniref:curli assembly chaperone CsgC n=1 Tax=Enterobacteriaceae TaxID=543 RepID=UPI001927E77C|nr:MULTISPECIES: curli assembly chaperone CsgC [Enterobacteriaceae]MCT4706054.1 curli assembly protein CsgC [Dryocola clanedunensis]MCT4712801.1 curli assembly protein CsgC [Dryocola clanedunensis]
MHTLILLAALSNQLSFTTQQQGNIYTIEPVATLTADCQCAMKLAATRAGAGGSSTSHQRSTVFIRANEPSKLTTLSLNIDPGDTVSITVTLSDGKDLHLEKQWVMPGKI